MSEQIDYFFTSISPFAYLGHRELMEISAKTGKPIHYRPFNIFEVWENSGAVPPAKRPPVRQRYRLIELQRISGMKGLGLNLAPKFFPTDPTLADHCICALVKSGADPASFCFEAGRAVWARDMQVSDRKVLEQLLEECGHDAGKILDLADSEDITAMRAENTKNAVAQDAVGAPAYVYKGEVFWGQDRLGYLEHMIKSDREPFTANL